MEQWTILTGASSGIGLEYARVLAQKRHNLILIARNQKAIEELSKELISNYSIKCRPFPLDLNSQDAIQTLEKYCNDNKLEINYLINNAGVGVFDYFHQIQEQRLMDMLNLNMNVPTLLTKLFLPKMIKKNSGGIQFIASIASYLPTPLYSNYGATKAYLRHFGTSLHYELKKTNIKINVFNPGVTKTRFFENADQKNSIAQQMQMMSAKRCAQLAYKALMKNKATSLPGFINNFTVSVILKITPLFLQARVIINDLLKNNSRKL